MSCIHLQIGVGIGAFPTADAVATGKVNCYNFIGRLRPLPLFVEVSRLVRTVFSFQCNIWPISHLQSQKYSFT